MAKTNNLRRSDGQEVFKVLNTINIFLILIKLKIGIQSSLRKSTIEGTSIGCSRISLAARFCNFSKHVISLFLALPQLLVRNKIEYGIDD